MTTDEKYSIVIDALTESDTSILREYREHIDTLLHERDEEYEMDTSNLMELQKAELLVKAQKKFSLQELEDMFGGNSFDL